MKLLEKNTDRTHSDINFSKLFFVPPPRVMKIKTKINKCDIIKHKMETIIETKRQPSEWKKILANEVTDKGLNSKICKQLMQLNVKTTTTATSNPIQKTEDLNRHFSKEDI